MKIVNIKSTDRGGAQMKKWLMVTGGVIVLAACTGADDEEVTDGAADTPG